MPMSRILEGIYSCFNRARNAKSVSKAIVISVILISNSQLFCMSIAKLKETKPKLFFKLDRSVPYPIILKEQNLAVLDGISTLKALCPDGIEESIIPHLKWLNLDSNQLENLSHELLLLTNLERVEISDNQLTTFECGVNDLPRLYDLNLSINNLRVVPSGILLLINLLRLNLASNKLKEVPKEIGNLVKLRSLYLSDNGLKAIPDEIARLTDLQYLFLDRNNLTDVRETMTSLRNLLSLNLARNKLKELPSTFGRLTSLRTLCVAQNELMALPVSIKDIEGFRIPRDGPYHELVLCYNSLSSFPNEICSFRSLNRLCLDHNMIKILPPEIGDLQGLAWLDLSFNKIETVPRSIMLLTNLCMLNLSNNELHSLTSEICRLRELKFIWLAHNKLTSLPLSIAWLFASDIEQLDIRDNKLGRENAGVYTPVTAIDEIAVDSLLDDNQERKLLSEEQLHTFLRKLLKKGSLEFMDPVGYLTKLPKEVLYMIYRYLHEIKCRENMQECEEQSKNKSAEFRCMAHFNMIEH